MGFEFLFEIGAAGFEPTTPTTPKWCATKLRYAPSGGSYHSAFPPLLKRADRLSRRSVNSLRLSLLYPQRRKFLARRRNSQSVIEANWSSGSVRQALLVIGIAERLGRSFKASVPSASHSGMSTIKTAIKP